MSFFLTNLVVLYGPLPLISDGYKTGKTYLCATPVFLLFGPRKFPPPLTTYPYCVEKLYTK
jgi:hypothetical protein